MPWKTYPPVPGPSLIPVFVSCFLFCLLMGMLSLSPCWAAESRSIEKLIEAAESPEDRLIKDKERQAIFNQGRRYYARFCVHCHGEKGRGNGPASEYLRPAPRDLSMGVFKFRSTRPNTLPVDEDLIKTIRHGVPGTAMPVWQDILNDEAIHAIVQYIKSFSDRFHRETPDQQMKIGLEPPFDSLSVATGQKLYSQLRCGKCHGAEGEKSGPLKNRLNDLWGHTSYVYDLRNPALYKAGVSGNDIYRTLVTGIDGTPMSAYDYLGEDETWHLTHYLQSLFDDSSGPREHGPYYGKLISYRTQGNIEVRPDHSYWKDVVASKIQLLSLRNRKQGPRWVRVQSIHNDHQIAFRLQWNDPVPDGTRTAPVEYLDAAALQFFLGPGALMDAPFFGMGEHDKRVNLWHWKADIHQKIVAKRRGNVTDPIIPDEWSQSKTTLFLDSFRDSPVEELNSSGFGSLSVQALENQDVSGKGVWENGLWSLVFVRDRMTSGPGDVDLQNPERVLMALAIWDGANQDKNAGKLVSLWQVLEFEK